MECCPAIPLNSDLSEIVAYNDPDFPAYIKTGQLSHYPDFRAVTHWHDDLEFILIQDGELFYDVNGQHIFLREGEGIFVNSRCLHYGYSNTHSECHFLCIILSPSILSANAYVTQNFIDPLIKDPHFPFQKLTPAISWQGLILRDISELYTSNSEKIYPLIIIQKLAHIFELLSENKNSTSDYDINTDDIQALTAMIGYIQKNYQNKLLLKDISSAGNCCKTKCSSLFQKYLSTTPILYLNNYRLEKGSALLRSTALSVTEIAYTCGFSGTSYFCEQFHRYYHVTPKTYREQNLRTIVI